MAGAQQAGPASSQGAPKAEGDQKAEAPKVVLITAIVAPGRSVRVDGKYKTPGEEVSLPQAEVARLRKSGALVDPGKPPAPRTNGAVFAKR